MKERKRIWQERNKKNENNKQEGNCKRKIRMLEEKTNM